MYSLLDDYTPEEFNEIAKQSVTFSDFSRKLGYRTDSTKTRELIKKRIEKYNTDISHFQVIHQHVKYTEEEIFQEDSPAGQSVVRNHFKDGNYQEYKCSICGQLPIWQNKPLTLILDHIDGNNKNQSLNNLRWVCPNCNQQLETTGSKNPYRKQFKTENSKPVNRCIDCGKIISDKSVRCMECYSKFKRIPLSDMIVSREDLKNLIRNTSFAAIGRKYGVTDNSVRKWCIKYNLPSKKHEIERYSDEEWSKI